MGSPRDKSYSEGKYSTYKFNEHDFFLRSSLGLYAQEGMQLSEIPLVLRGLSRGSLDELAIIPASKVLKEPPEDLYFLYGPISKPQIVQNGRIEPREEVESPKRRKTKNYEERENYNHTKETSTNIVINQVIPQEAKGKRNLEGRIAFTNVTKGKLGIVLGKTFMGLGLLPPAIGVGSYFLQQSQGANPNSDSITNLAIGGGIAFGAGLLVYTIGKIRNWFWNKNYY